MLESIIVACASHCALMSHWLKCLQCKQCYSSLEEMIPISVTLAVALSQKVMSEGHNYEESEKGRIISAQS
eukprot:4832025-Amphidinium_carterae.1